jgi:hypothetical protein
MNSLIKKLDSLIEKLASSRVFKSDFDYHLVRGSMVFVFLMFGYQKRTLPFTPDETKRNRISWISDPC